jgi:hypothetical protein
MVNLVLQRLAHTGYIKVATLNRRKMSYLLTPKGLAEKSKRSYNYFLRTIHVYDQYRKRIERLIQNQIQNGHHQFIVYGEGDLADMVKVILRDKGNAVEFKAHVPPHLPSERNGHLILNCCLADDQPLEGISILENILEATTQNPQGELHELV